MRRGQDTPGQFARTAWDARPRWRSRPGLDLADRASAPVRELLAFAPQPFLLTPQNLLIYWSPRSACTKILVWYLAQTSLLHAANFYSNWPHDFRMGVLDPSRQLQIWRERLNPKAVKAVRFVRHPDHRAVSGFRHLLATGRRGFTPHHLALSMRLRRRVNAQRGITFQEFLDYCRASMGWRFDFHYRIQAHPLEAQIPPTQTVRLEEADLNAALDQLAFRHKLRVTDIQADETYAQIDSRHRAKPDRAASVAPVDDVVFSTADALDAWPATERSLTPPARAKIRTIFAEDFRRYYPDG